MPSSSSSSSPSSSAGHQHHHHHHQQQSQPSQRSRVKRTDLQGFWSQQLDAVEHLNYRDLHHELPLARVKKIMKVDQARVISGETPMLFAKACELFILDLTMRSWALTKGTSRCILQKSDVFEAIQSTELFDFLLDFYAEQLADPQDTRPAPTTAHGIAEMFEKSVAKVDMDASSTGGGAGATTGAPPAGASQDKSKAARPISATSSSSSSSPSSSSANPSQSPTKRARLQ